MSPAQARAARDWTWSSRGSIAGAGAADPSDTPGGAGELAVAPAMAAVACAYGRATGTMPTTFPINHGTLAFTPKPTVPPVPPSPADGLDHVR